MIDTGAPLDRRAVLKGILGGAAGLAGASALGACAGNASAASTDPLQLWHLFTGADGEKLIQMLADVKAKNPATATNATALAWGSP